MAYRWAELARSVAVRVAAWVVLVACVACSDNSVLTPQDGGVSTVQFADTGVLTLAPKQTATISLSGSNVSTVTLSLGGNYLDAFLDSDSVDLAGTPPQGTFTLHAPSSASTFSLLAAAGQATARLDVAVSAVGFANIRVTMNYQGKRAVPIVAASTFLETTCAQLGNAATDGAPLVVGTYGDKLVIPSVPTDGQVAVNVRIAHYATGCLDIPSLAPNTTRDVTVNVFDLPLDLKDTTLETRFTFTPSTTDATALSAYLDQDVSSAVLAASFPSSGSEGSLLLDAMGAASTSPTAFATARNQSAWDTTVDGWLALHSPTMSSHASTWLHEASQVGIGDLTGHLASDPAEPVFTPKTLGTLTASVAGISAPLPFAWTGQPGDILSLSGAVEIVPSQFACAMADLRAQADVPTSTGVASALSHDIDCQGIATTLAQGGYAFGTCDSSCVDALCVTALTNLWGSGATSLSKTSDIVTLSLSVAAPAQVGDTANVQSFVGSWVGSLAYGSSKINTQGVAKGAFGTVPN